MKTNPIIIILGIAIVSSVIFAVAFQMPLDNSKISFESPLYPESEQKQCDIPYDEYFIQKRAINASIATEFSIYSTVPIDVYSVDNNTHSLILKPVPTSNGYIVMCDPLPVLEKRFETKLESLAILVDGIEIPYEMQNNVLRIDVNNNTSIEIVGFSKI